jgi:glycosyltransferase involved in cell wall biosynthesis
MKPKYIVHVDYGSCGNSGFYIERLLQATSIDCHVRAYVHSEFGESKSEAQIMRIFDRWSAYALHPKIKSIIKFIDIYLCFLKIFFDVKTLSKVYDVQLYCAFFQSFHVYYWFFNIVRKYCNLNVTVHDAVELEHKYPAFIMTDRDNCLRQAHRLIVHGEESLQILSALNIPLSIIRFPVQNRQILESYQKDFPVKFLFIGHIRKEKGIGNLIHAWSMLSHDGFDKSILTIAGNDDLNLGRDALKLPNCITKFGYIDDEDFEALIQDTDYVVLPYEGGTNSGVLSAATSFGKPCITSMIPCFSQSQYFIEALSFREPEELLPLIMRIIRYHLVDYTKYVEFLRAKNINYQHDFDEDINQMYKVMQN